MEVSPLLLEVRNISVATTNVDKILSAIGYMDKET